MKLYTQKGCSLCMLSKSIMKAKKISFEEFTDEELIRNLANEHSIRTMPMLKNKLGLVFSGQEAVEYLKGF